MANDLLNSLSLMVLVSYYLLSLLDKVPTISKKIVDEIIDNDLEENIFWHFFANKKIFLDTFLLIKKNIFTLFRQEKRIWETFLVEEKINFGHFFAKKINIWTLFWYQKSQKLLRPTGEDSYTTTSTKNFFGGFLKIVTKI